MVKTLLSYGADTETPCQDDGTTPLWRSCQKGHKDIVELLISYGADVNKSRNYGSTPTYIARFYFSKEKSQHVLTEQKFIVKTDTLRL